MGHFWLRIALVLYSLGLLHAILTVVGRRQKIFRVALGAISLATREELDNLIFVINCNLQRLDGPVRGNGKIIQELEAIFRGAGWNVLKVIWGTDWDSILENDTEGLLSHRMGEMVDGEYQKFVVESGAYIRKHWFGHDPRLLKLVEHVTDEQLPKLRLGGHDPRKVYAVYKAAFEHKGAPTVILARTIKGYGLGESGEGKNISHQQKKINEDELYNFKARFGDKIREATATERQCALSMLTRCNRLEDLSFELDHIPGDQFGYVFPGFQTKIYFVLGIEPAEASRLLRAFVKATGIRLKKEFRECRGTFAAASYEPGDPNVAFEDFVPQECHIEPVTRLVPEHEETSYKVVCSPPEAAEATVEPNGEVTTAPLTDEERTVITAVVGEAKRLDMEV